MKKNPKGTLVCASGRGSNFRAVFHAIQNKKIRNCKILALFTDRPNTPAEDFAQKQGLRTKTLDFHSFPSRSHFNEAFFKYVQKIAPDLILTLGYLRVLSSEMIQAFHGQIINIHPSLLPAFKGMHAQRQALEYGVHFTGATLHFVDEGIDTGPIISQAVVPIKAQDSEESLSKRILEVEHELLVKSLDLFCTGNLKIIGTKVEILA